MQSYYLYDVDAALQALGAGRDGLSEEEARARHEEHGPNELARAKKKSIIRRFGEQLINPMVVVLMAAAAVSVLIAIFGGGHGGGHDIAEAGAGASAGVGTGAGVGEYVDACIIMAVVILNSILGVFQESKAEKAIEALQEMSAATARVRRGGVVAHVPASGLVVGDVVLIEAGDALPADMRLIHAASLRVEEAALTGESVPVDKITEALGGGADGESGEADGEGGRTDGEGAKGAPIPLGDRKNMAYMGSSVAYGRGEGVVTAIGMDTEVGKIAGIIQRTSAGETPLQMRLSQLSKILSAVVLGICAVIFFIRLAGAGEINAQVALDSFMLAVSLAVAAIPEGLVAVVTIVLSIGVTNMAKRNAIVRRLTAVETLGCTQIICSDKTGTLTQNKMTVVESYGDAGLLAKAMALCCDSQLAPDGSIVGDPTENALVAYALKNGFDKNSLAAEYPRIAEAPFDSSRKMMSTVHAAQGSAGGMGGMSGVGGMGSTGDMGGMGGVGGMGSTGDMGGMSGVGGLGGMGGMGGIGDIGSMGGMSGVGGMGGVSSVGINGGGAFVQFTKGAPDEILRVCTHFLVGDGSVAELTDEARAAIAAKNNEFADRALRVLACAYKTYAAAPAEHSPASLENGLTFIGLEAMIDPVRPEVGAAVESCRRSGITVVMITGDHRDTAVAIAKELGIVQSADQAITGRELDALSDAEFERRVLGINVYARVQPEHKVRIVNMWKQKGYVTAMTGDGVNDAPAIKSGDIGVGMGITGTDVTKNVADMVLADDNFATIVSAVEEGRRIYDNIRKTIQFLLASNLSEVLSILVATLMGFVLFKPVHLLFINLVTDSIPAVALGMEAAQPGIMERPPRGRDEGVFSGGLGSDLIYQGVIVALLTLAAYHIVDIWHGHDYAMTSAFLTMSMCEIFHSYNMRSQRQSLFALKTHNKLLWYAMAASLVLTLTIIYVPFLSSVFSLMPLTARELTVSLGLALMVIPLVEAVKAVQRRGD
ncbi:MAG: cation-translocating P-type ATPase [Oscillospiraceae bacterium]|nr:cation-translocating P-type ATPase [Oscillospiraceae bacterium]